MVTDFLGTPIEVGCVVVYPALSGRSTQMVEAEVLSFEVLGQDAFEALHEYHKAKWTPTTLTKVKVQPTGRSSRWKQHHSARSWDGEQMVPHTPKPATLTANARSIVVVANAGAPKTL